ncbi:MAG: hypothetical protein Aurels2KO_40700 [Aureliella sp.]
MQFIVTHPGGAHKDDFLACCLLAHLHGVPIQRREPVDEDLVNADICVVDVGERHQPELNNFDHHQFPRDAPPQCALSLVLQNLGLYEDALAFCPWLRPAEWLDTLGPNKAAELMEIPRAALSALNSPIDMTLLKRFSATSEMSPENPIYQLMCMVGEDIVGYLRSLRRRIDFLKDHAEAWEIETEGEPIHALFLQQTDEIAEDPSFGLYAFIESQDLGETIQALVYPDRRGEGYGLTRYDDCQRLDFSRIESLDEVRFAHKRGFVAKVTTTDTERLKQLIALAVVDKG